MRLGISILTLISVLGMINCTQRSDDSKSEPIRGVWVTNIDSDVMFSEENIIEGMKTLADLGFNTVYPVVWNKGYTMHPSEVMVQYFGEEYQQDTLFKNRNLDPLAVMIREARKNDLKIIPWFEFGFSSSYNKNGGHIIEAYPSWAALDNEGNLLKKNNFDWMNAIHPEVQQFMISLILEVVKGYDIDGIQGDDRLPAMPAEGGYSAFTKSLYLNETGNEVPSDPLEEGFLNWKADKLTDFAVQLYQAVKAEDANLTVSLAPSIYPWSKEEYLQDWPAWIEAGAVDELIPQAYRWDIDSYKATIDEMVEYYQQAEGHEKVSIYPGIIIKAGDRYNNFDYVKEALLHNRKKGLDGEVYFFYEGLFEENDHLGDSLHTHFYSN